MQTATAAKITLKKSKKKSGKKTFFSPLNQYFSHITCVARKNRDEFFKAFYFGTVSFDFIFDVLLKKYSLKQISDFTQQFHFPPSWPKFDPWLASMEKFRRKLNCACLTVL
jgi:hypothetical protein